MQSINLLQPGLLPRPDHCTLRNCGLALAVVVVLGLGYGVNASVHSRALAAETAGLEARQAELSAKIEPLKRPPDASVRLQLETQIASAEAALANRRRLAQVLAGGGLGNTRGFAEQLKTLAEQLPEGIALEAIALKAGGRELALAGAATQPAVLPRYIAALTNAPAFTLSYLGHLKVTHEPGHYRFTVGEPTPAERKP